MVKRIISVLSGKTNGIHSAAYLLGFFALVSQLIGLLRDRLLAGTFGAGRELDLYYASFRLPDFLFILVASAVSASVLIPFLSGSMENDKQSARKFADSVISVLSIVLVLAGGASFFLAPYFLEKFFPLLYRSDAGILIAMTRIMLLQPVFLGLSNLLGSIAQSSGRFTAYAVAPVFYNLGIVVGIMFLFPYFGLNGLALGVVLGALLHLLAQMPAVFATGVFPRLTLAVDWKAVSALFRLSLPRSLALSAGSLSFLALTAIASRIGEGSVAVFNLSWNMQSVPLAIIGASYSMAAFPTLSALFSSGNKEKFLYYLDTALRHTVFWSMPIIVLFIVLRAQIVRTVFGFGNFDWSDTRLTAALLAVFAVSVLAQGIVVVVSRAYYAAGMTKLPFIVNTFFSVATIAGASVAFEIYRLSPNSLAWLQKILRVDGLEGSTVLVLPVVFSAIFIINAVVMLIFFARRFGWPASGFLKVLSVSAGCSLIAGFCAYAGLNFMSNLVNLNTVAGIFTQGLTAGILGIFAYIASMRLMGSGELADVASVAVRKIKNASIVEDDTESQKI